MKKCRNLILGLALFMFIATVPRTSFSEMQGDGEGKGGMMGGGMPMTRKMTEMGPMTGMGMMEGVSGKGKAEGDAKAAPKRSEEASPGGADLHGH